MISLPDRERIVALIDEAVENGARRMPAAHLLGLTIMAGVAATPDDERDFGAEGGG